MNNRKHKKHRMKHKQKPRIRKKCCKKTTKEKEEMKQKVSSVFVENFCSVGEWPCVWIVVVATDKL